MVGGGKGGRVEGGVEGSWDGWGWVEGEEEWGQGGSGDG